jgi:DNA-binding transcriptional LysR family regulator
MLDLRRLRLLRELEARGTIAAVADALQYTPSAVSQQLAVLEREAGVPLLEKAGRGVRLTDAAVVLVRHAEALLERAELAESDLAAAARAIAGRTRIATFQSGALLLAVPAMEEVSRDAPGLRCEILESEPEQSLPALALGDVDVVVGDEWQHQPHPRPPGVTRHDLHRDPVLVVLPAGHPATRRAGGVPLRALRDEPFVCGQRGTGWEEMTVRACRELGGFDPDLRHRTNDSVTCLAVVGHGQGVTLLPRLVAPVGTARFVVRPIAGGAEHRTIFVATRTADAGRPAVQAIVAAIEVAAESLGDDEATERR